jgi:hypothetical protein
MSTVIKELPKRKFFNINNLKSNNTHSFQATSFIPTPPLTPNRSPKLHATSLSSSSSSTLFQHWSLSDNSRFLINCLLWYLSSSLSSNTGKQIMNHFKYPVTLTFAQFFFVACWCATIEFLFRTTGIKKPTKTIIQTIVPLSLFMTVGHILSSVAISRIPVSLVHTIKVSLQSGNNNNNDDSNHGNHRH